MDWLPWVMLLGGSLFGMGWRIGDRRGYQRGEGEGRKVPPLQDRKRDLLIDLMSNPFPVASAKLSQDKEGKVLLEQCVDEGMVEIRKLGKESYYAITEEGRSSLLYAREKA